MHEIPPIITERVDDIPLLLQPMQRRGLPRLFDDHFPPHGNWTGLRLGWVSPSWLSSIVARGDHRMVHVEPWGAKRLGRLGATTGQAVPPVDGTDARRESVLRRWRDDERWSAFAAALHQHTVRGYALSTARVQVERTRASASATGTEGGLLPCGHSKEYRPDLPPVNVRQAVLEPLGMPLATAVVAGERAADPLALPGSKRGQARRGRHGLFYGGDGTMASRATRACMAASGDFSLGPRPQGHRTEGECDAALAAVGCGAQPLTPVVRAHPPGEPELSAEGDAYGVAMSQKRDDQMHNWTARRWVVRSVRPAHAAAVALRARVSKAMPQMEALKQRGRGKKRCETVAAFRQAVGAIVQRYGVENLGWFRLPPHVPPRPGRASRGQPARVAHAWHATVEVCVDEAAVAAAVPRLGWRV